MRIVPRGGLLKGSVTCVTDIIVFLVQLANYLQSIAYEIAPFNVKVTVIQNNLEVNLLTNKISSVAPLDSYSAQKSHTLLARDVITKLLEGVAHRTQYGSSATSQSRNYISSPCPVSSFHPSSPSSTKTALVAETVHAIIAIGGHESPPSRHLVGAEAVASVKERLKTLSEELEDLIEVSYSVDFDNDTNDASKTEDDETE